MSVTRESDIGWESFEGNESSTGAKNFDPAKNRVATPISPTDGGGGGVWSANRARNTGQVCEGGQQEEMGFIRIEQSESVRRQESNLRSELNVFLNDGSGADDSAMVRAFAIECDRITKINPGLLNSLRQMIGGGGVTDTMWAPDGLSFTQQQNDQNFVSYQVDRPFDKSANPKALWSAWTGRL